MGKYNSSVYRLKPLFDIISNEQNIVEMLNLLLSTVALDEEKSLGEYCIEGQVYDIRYDGAKDGEKPLRPKFKHLIAILDYLGKQNPKLLCDRFCCELKDLDIRITTAKEDIRQMYLSDWPLPKHKAVMEGNSFPDVYIETDSEIIVIEAKWTESKTTTQTTYLENRNQLARHIQAALVLGEKTNKRVISFYIVADRFLKDNPEIITRHGFEHSLSNETIDIGDKQDIIEGYFGYTTWERLQEIIEIKFLGKQDIDSMMSI